MNPKSFNDFQAKIEKSFTLFLESPHKLYLPRFYAQNKLGEPTCNELTKGQDISLQFNGSIKKKKKPIVDTYINSTRYN